MQSTKRIKMRQQGVMLQKQFGANLWMNNLNVSSDPTSLFLAGCVSKEAIKFSKSSSFPYMNVYERDSDPTIKQTHWGGDFLKFETSPSPLMIFPFFPYFQQIDSSPSKHHHPQIGATLLAGRPSDTTGERDQNRKWDTLPETSGSSSKSILGRLNIPISLAPL